MAAWRDKRLILASTAGVLIVGYVGAAWATSSRVPRSTTVAGLAIGGLDRDAAAARLSAAYTGLNGALPVQAAGRTTNLDLAVAGLRLDAKATVDELVGFSLNPVRLWRQVGGGGARTPLPPGASAQLESALGPVVASTARRGTDASISYKDGVPVLTPAADGIEVRLPAAVRAIRSGWLARGGAIVLPTQAKKPAITQAEGEAALEKLARPAVAAPLSVTVGERKVSLTPARLAPTLSFIPKDGELQLTVDGPKLRAAVLAADPELGSEPKDARIVVKNGKPAVIPGVSGIVLDATALARAVLPALTDGTRVASVPGALTAPKLTTEAAEKLGVIERISTFSTILTDNAARTENLRVAARTVNGTLVRPGESFSLNGVLGQRTPQKGYNQAPAINGGRLVNDYGGGVSQMATTIFNNVFFAGLEDVHHKPHSFYISRYPEGREATVNYPSVDLKWRNDSPYAVLIAANVTSTVNVSFYGTKVWDITASKGPRSNYRTPETVFDESPGCVPQGANSGFDVSVTRTFRRHGSTSVVKSETFHTSYIAEDRVTCGPKPQTAE